MSKKEMKVELFKVLIDGEFAGVEIKMEGLRGNKTFCVYSDQDENPGVKYNEIPYDKGSQDVEGVKDRKGQEKKLIPKAKVVWFERKSITEE